MPNQESMSTTSDRSFIMMVDDEPAITDSLGYSLSQAGLNSIAATTLAEADQILEERGTQIQLVILDLSLPDGHGFDWLKRLRNTSMLPVIILSSHDDEIEHIVGLEIGADDFIDKPFSPREVVARVRAVLRRSTHAWSTSGFHTSSQAQSESNSDTSSPLLRDSHTEGGVSTLGDATPLQRSHTSPIQSTHSTSDSAHSSALKSPLDATAEAREIWIDYDQYRVVCGRVSLGLSQQEFALFDAICSGRGKVFTRAHLLRVAWGGGVSVSERTVDVHITSLRKKWAERYDSELIETVRGVGYRLADDAPPIFVRGVKPS